MIIVPGRLSVIRRGVFKIFIKHLQLGLNKKRIKLKIKQIYLCLHGHKLLRAISAAAIVIAIGAQDTDGFHQTNTTISMGNIQLPQEHIEQRFVEHASIFSVFWPPFLFAMDY